MMGGLDSLIVVVVVVGAKDEMVLRNLSAGCCVK